MSKSAVLGRRPDSRQEKGEGRQQKTAILPTCTYCSACSTRSVSSTLRPNARLLIVECCTTPSRSMMKRPRSAMPSGESTPYESLTSFLRSATRG